MSKISDISDIFLFNLTTNLKTFNLQPDRYDTVLYRYPCLSAGYIIQLNTSALWLLYFWNETNTQTHLK